MKQINDGGMPLGLGIALAQNEAAFSAFGRMSAEQRNGIIQQARSARSKQEMQEIVNSISQQAQ